MSRYAILKLILAIVINLTVITTASASLSTVNQSMQLIAASCPVTSDQSSELKQLKQAILNADNLQTAQELALAPTEDALHALNSARVLMPFSEDLATAANQLQDSRQRILLASSQAIIADEFDGMMLASLDHDRAAHVKIGGSSCNYSSGELIAITIGLILGIIPGLILLLVLC